MEGRRPVLEALRAKKPLRRILLADGVERGHQIDEIIELARAAGLPVEPVRRRDLDRVAATKRHQGVVAVAPDPDYTPLGDLLAAAVARPEPALIAVLDGIEDPHNFGAIVRTVDGAGGHGVVIPTRRAVGITPGARKASAGALEHVPIARVVNLSRAIEQIKEAGLWVIGLDLEANRSHTEVDMTGPIAVVVGAEGAGLSRLVRDKCDVLASIPLKGRLESLNASVAAAIALYEAARQRDAMG